MKLNELLPQAVTEEAKIRGVLKLPAITTEPEFEDSSDFEEMFSNIDQAMLYAKQALESDAFEDWMKASASNYSFSLSHYKTLMDHVSDAHDALHKVYDELEKASG